MRGSRVVAGTAVAAALMIGAAALSAAGDAGSAQGQVEWKATPRVAKVPELPRDRVLSGEIRNASQGELDLEAHAVELLDARGRAVPSTARFAAAFGHGLYSPTAPPGEVAELEQRRLGEIVTLAPGDSAPLTLSWRLRADGRRPVVARFEGIALRLPRDR